MRNTRLTAGVSVIYQVQYRRICTLCLCFVSGNSFKKFNIIMQKRAHCSGDHSFIDEDLICRGA